MAWNCTPPHGCDNHKAWRAGYSDAFHGYRRGTAYEGDQRCPEAYVQGYEAGLADANKPALRYDTGLDDVGL